MIVRPRVSLPFVLPSWQTSSTIGLLKIHCGRTKINLKKIPHPYAQIYVHNLRMYQAGLIIACLPLVIENIMVIIMDM